MQNSWIHINDKLPCDNQEVIVKLNIMFRQRSKALYAGGKFTRQGVDITAMVRHWMPLPERNKDHPWRKA